MPFHQDFISLSLELPCTFPNFIDFFLSFHLVFHPKLFHHGLPCSKSLWVLFILLKFANAFQRIFFLIPRSEATFPCLMFAFLIQSPLLGFLSTYLTIMIWLTTTDRFDLNPALWTFGSWNPLLFCRSKVEGQNDFLSSYLKSIV